MLILAAGGVDSETADSLTELVISQVAERGGARIVGKEEFQAQLGQGEARSVECVSSAACLGRVGVELDVDEVIAGTVARRGDTWVFNVNRIDIRSGELAGRAFREVPGDVGAVADALGQAVPSLYEAPERPARLLVSANVEGAEVTVDGALVGVYRGEPVGVEEVAPGRHEISVRAPDRVQWSRTVNVADGATLQLDASLEPLPSAGEAHVSPLVYIGGAIAILGAGAGVYFGLASRDQPDEGTNRADSVAFVEDRKRDALYANIAFGAAAAGAVAVGLGLLLSDFDPEPTSARVAVSPTDGGAAVGVGGRF